MTFTVIILIAYTAGGLLWTAYAALEAETAHEPLTYGGLLGEALAWPYRIYLKFKG